MLEQLKVEFSEDPENLGYSNLSTLEKISTINLRRENVKINTLVGISDLLKKLTPAVFRIAVMPEPGRTAWLEILKNLRRLEIGLMPSDPEVQQLLGMAVQQGVLEQSEKESIEQLGTRNGSRAEQLFGENTVITLNDVAKLL